MALADKLTEIGKITFKDPTKGLFGGAGDLMPILANLGISVQDFTNLISGRRGGRRQAHRRSCGRCAKPVDITTDTYVQMKNGLQQYQSSAAEAEAIQAKMNEAFVVTNDLARGAFFNWLLATDPARLYGDELLRIDAALDSAKGKIGSVLELPPDVLRDMEIVAEALGVDLPAVFDLAEQAGADAEGKLQAVQDAIKGADRPDQGVQGCPAGGGHPDPGHQRRLGGSGRHVRTDRHPGRGALSAIFELGNAPLDAAARYGTSSSPSTTCPRPPKSSTCPKGSTRPT